MRQIKRLGERLSVLEESLLSAERGAPEMGENFDQLIAQSKLMQQELHLVRKHLETSSPGEALPENNSANVVEFPYGSAWGWVGYGLAALFALLMLLT
ncbi:MAG: hypothetical protein JJU29_11710 [Verrucomicrobia bacterium]|nr:hypothetical protein [Verrucomicrobiota bacterium]MCH8510135.1 hypothetical protein [Kiritimatiellia bacterium]